MLPEEDEAQRDPSTEPEMPADAGMRARRASPEPVEGERPPASAEHRARRAWLGDAVLRRRAEAAEASVGGLEAQLAERELELRRVKQREHAEQQLRVEAEEVAIRARRGHRAELDRWQRRLDAAHAASRRAETQRDALAARLADVSESAERLSDGVHSLQRVTAELRACFEREHADSRARIGELEARLQRLRAPTPLAPVRPDAQESQRREEMASALAAAVARLRSRAAAAEPSPTEPSSTELSSTERPPTEWESSPTEPSPRASSERDRAAAPVPATPAGRPAPGASEVSTVIVVPRLFAGNRRSGSRLAPIARRIAVRLARWADRAQQRAR